MTDTLPRHLRVQLTLLATTVSGRKSPLPAQGFQAVLVSPGRSHFTATIFPSQSMVPGGAAVNCEVMFLLQDALGHFPAGTQFDLWDGGRKGYGTTLAVLS
jgi:hypothetical protein